MGVIVYGISPSNSDDHAYLKDSVGLDFELLEDASFSFGDKLGFVDLEKQTIFRGYVAVNLETKTFEKEVDYLAGENVKEVIAVLEDL